MTRIETLRLRRDGAMALAARCDNATDRKFWERRAAMEQELLLIEERTQPGMLGLAPVRTVCMNRQGW